MEGKCYLVQRGQLDAVLADLINKQETVMSDIDKCLPVLNDEDLIKKMKRQRDRAEAQLIALRAGYVPIIGGWFWDIDTKSKWGHRAVKEVMETMPEEIKKLVEDEKESGTFDKLKVNGRRNGDPILVGTKGGVNFLLAMWCNLAGGYAIGFTAKGRFPVNV